MKKFLSLLLAIVMIVSIFPAQILSASAEDVSVTLSIYANTGTLASDSSSISWTSNGITFTNEKASSTSAIRTSDSDHFRVYANSAITVSSTVGNITKIVVTCTSSSYATALVTSVGSEASASNSTVTITPTTPAESYSIAKISAQVRLKTVVVTYSKVDSVECSHTNTETVEAVAATCTTPGYTAGVLCSDCEAYVSGHEVVAATGHAYGDWVDTTAATCTEAGEQSATCANCGDVKTQTVAALGHIFVDGTCTGCGHVAVFTEYELVTSADSLKAGNQFVLVAANADGAYYVMIPYASGNNLKAEAITAPVDGKISLPDTSAAAIITLGGDSTGWTLFDGAKYLYSAGGTSNNYLKGVAELPTDNTGAWTIAINADGIATIVNVGNSGDSARNVIKFNYGNSSVLFSNYASSYTTNVSMVSIYCLPTEVEEPSCAHENTTTNTVDATCTEAGSTTVVCDDCGETVSTEEIAALGHNYVDDVCSVCGAEFEGDIDTPDVCEHETTNTFITDATCVTAGSTTVICEDCGEAISTEEIPATGVHTEVTDAAVAATCTAAGLTEGSHCSVCSTVIVAQEEIAALGHNYVDGTCSNCGEAEPVSYELVTADTVRAGNYIIGAIRSSTVTYPAVYLATGTVSSGDMVVASTSTTATDDVIALAADAGAKVFVLTGDNTNGFTIGYNNGTEMVYLGYTSVANRKLAFSADYSNILWKVQTFNSGVMLTDGNINIFENSTGTGAIRGYTTTYTSARGIYLFREVVENECIHTVETWTVDVAPTCTANGTQSGVCTLCGETQTSAVPATGHALAYSDSAIICANGCDYSQAYTLSTIAEAKVYTDTTLVYYIKGIVTYIDGAKVYIEDATGGLLVNFTSADAASGIALGDEILVWDTMTTWNSLIETTYTMATEYVKASEGNTLPSQTVSIADLLADTTNEYLAERVVIENVTIGTINTSGNTALTDADGNTINIYKVSGLSEDINENDTVTVTAIVSTFSGYQLLINPGTAAADVVETVSGEETVVTTVTIEEAKAGTAGEYYQVEGTVTYISGRNVYIQDATGGIVVYLTANAATTQVGDTVKAYGALKNYYGLLELENVDETNEDFYQILSSGNTVDAQSLTIEELNDDEVNAYLAEKILLENVYVSYYSYSSSYGNVTYTLTDGNGNTVQIYRTAVASEAECVAGGSIVTVEAVVSRYATDSTEGNGYQLLADNDMIKVTGTCAHETTELVNYVAPTYTSTGYSGDTLCTVCQNYVERGETLEKLNVYSWNISLGDSIGVNFVMPELADTDIVTATVNGITVDDIVMNGTTVSIVVAAAQMTDEIVIYVNGTAMDSVYSVRDYASTILDGDYDDATKNLVKHMLNYGAASQNYFQYNNETEENLANYGISVDAAEVPATGDEVVVFGELSGVTFYGASLVHKNKIAVRFYFKADSVEGIDFGGYEYTEVNGMYCIEVAGINPQELDQDITIVVSNGTDELSVSYAPMDYIIRMYNKADTSDTTKALVQALYGYHLAAKDYKAAEDDSVVEDDSVAEDDSVTEEETLPDDVF